MLQVCFKNACFKYASSMICVRENLVCTCTAKQKKLNPGRRSEAEMKKLYVPKKNSCCQYMKLHEAFERRVELA
jgi:hypothetical protein